MRYVNTQNVFLHLLVNCHWASHKIPVCCSVMLTSDLLDVTIVEGSIGFGQENGYTITSVIYVTAVQSGGCWTRTLPLLELCSCHWRWCEPEVGEFVVPPGSASGLRPHRQHRPWHGQWRSARWHPGRGGSWAPGWALSHPLHCGWPTRWAQRSAGRSL